MTALTKAITRKVNLVTDYRRTARRQDQIAVTLYPDGEIGFRVSRCRKEHRLPLSTVYLLAVRESEREHKAAQAAERKRK